MFKSRRAGSGIKILLSALSLHMAGTAYGATVGQLSGNTSIWANSGNFSTIYTAATVGAGHTVESAETLTAQNISNNTHFIVESSATALAAAQVSLLVDYVRGGGTLLLFASPTTSNTSANQIMTALGNGVSGTSMRATTERFGFTGSNVNWGQLNSTDPSVQGVYNLNNASLSYTQSNVLTGGTLLAANNSYTVSDAVRVDRYNLGKVYLFGTHFDKDTSTVNQSNTFFFLNILANGGLPSGLVDVGGEAPEPATFALTAASLVGALLYVRRKRT